MGSVACVQPRGQWLVLSQEVSGLFSQGVSGLCSAKRSVACSVKGSVACVHPRGQGLVFSQEAVLVHVCACLKTGNCMCMENFM